MSLRPLRTYVIPGLVLSLTTLVAACGDDGVGNAGGEGGSSDTSSSGSTKSSSKSASASQSASASGMMSGSSTTTSSASTTATASTTTTASTTATASASTTATTASSTASTAASSTSSGMGNVEVCGDNVDNDMDNDIDCADADCDASIFCNAVVINELDYDRNGADDAATEFVELFNDGANAVVLDGVEVLLINGNAMPAPNVYTTIDLTGTTIPAGGFVVVGGASTPVPPGVPLVTFAGGLQNGASATNANGDAVVIWDTVSATLIDAVSYENTVADADIHGTVVDAFETTFALGDLDLGNSDPNIPFSINRFPDGTDTDNNGADFHGSATVTPGAANVISEHCSSTVDEDGDNAIDCADSNCSAAPNCGETCNDGIDNNANMLTDCQEASCDMLSCGTNGRVCAAGACACPNGTTEVCGDMADNNCDGLIDCADPTCNGSPACSEICTDGIDNNGNMDIDCADALCDGLSCGANGLTCAADMCSCPGGATEVCGDMADNNCNGLVDCAEASCAATPACMTGCTPRVLISQVYGAGGNSGATFRHDFVELHNQGPAAVNIGGWSLQYASAAGAAGFSQKLDIPGGTMLPAGAFYLIRLAVGAGTTMPEITTQDLSGSLALGGTAGKVALVNGTTLLGPTCSGATIVDLVAYGTTANCAEGQPTGDLSSILSASRLGNGCQDTDNNNSDFAVNTPFLRNLATTPNICTCN